MCFSWTGLNSRSPLSESKSTSSSLSALSDSLNSSECGDVTQGSEELKSLLAPPSSASSQSSLASGTEERSEKSEISFTVLLQKSVCFVGAVISLGAYTNYCRFVWVVFI